jgi:sugar transferase (PEP-CTERM system associated)
MRRGALSGVSSRVGMLVISDMSIVVGSMMAACYIRLGSADTWYLMRFGGGFAKSLVVACVCSVCLYYGDGYDLTRIRERRELFVGMIQGLACALALLLTAYFWFPALIIGRGVFLVAMAVLVVSLGLWRLAFEWLAWRAVPRERLLLAGTSHAAVELARELHERRHELGVEIVGFIDPDPARVGAPVLNPGVIGTLEDIPSIVRARNVDRVVVSLADARGRLPMDKLLELKLNGVTFDHLASVYEEYTGKIAVENLRPSWLIFSPGFRKTAQLTTAKRAIDILAGTVGMVLGAPLMLVIAVAVKLTSPGAVLYSHERVGRDGRLFRVHKFRSMVDNAEAESGPVWATRNDPRVTRLGRFLRRTRLDELPQFWTILRGQMSLVGPRPERPEFVAALGRDLPFYGQRHIVRPGLTGWAQVRYTYAASREDALQKLQYDLFYIKHMSLALDLFIVLSTVKTVILSRGAQ